LQPNLNWVFAQGDFAFCFLLFAFYLLFLFCPNKKALTPSTYQKLQSFFIDFIQKG